MTVVQILELYQQCYDGLLGDPDRKMITAAVLTLACVLSHGRPAA